MSTGGSAASWTLWPANSLAAIFDFAASSNRRALAVLAIVSLIAFMPGIFQIPPVDRDEARFAQATKQMIETGDYVDIRFQDEVRYKKPVGIYWLQAAVVKAAEALGVPRARTRISFYRIPSLVGALGAVLATNWCALAFGGRRGAALAALMMLGSTLLGVEARLAKTDAMLLLTVVVAMGALARVYLLPRGDGITPRDWALVAVFWTALAAGILLKGPVIVMIVGLTAAALSIFDRSGHWLMALRPLPGIIWLLVLVLPWFLAIYARAGGAFLTNAVGHDLLDKVAGGQESHGAPPGLYFILFFATFFPASILAGLAAPAVWSVRREPAVRFLLAWLLPSWIVFELIPTKLPHYVLPLYPAVAILISAAVETKALSRTRWQVRGVMWWFLAPIIAGTAAIIAAIMIDRSLALGAWPLFALAVGCGLLAWQLYEEDGAERALARAVAGWVLVAIAIYGLVVPALGPLFPSAALEQVLRRSGCSYPLAASAGYDEPSLVFLAGTATRLTDPSGAADFLREGGCRFAFVTVRQERAFALRAEAIGLRYDREPRIEAFIVTHGQSTGIAVFRSLQDVP
jgi:4-amino-4-deoxy-L-arabinose transferase-like glycosyltransferase